MLNSIFTCQAIARKWGKIVKVNHEALCQPYQRKYIEKQKYKNQWGEKIKEGKWIKIKEWQSTVTFEKIFKVHYIV